MYDAIIYFRCYQELMLLASLLSDDQKDELRRLYLVAYKKYKKLQRRRETTYAGRVKHQYGNWCIQYAFISIFEVDAFSQILKQVMPHEYNN